MTLKIYNSKTNRKEIFEPIDVNHVKLYLCGPTVYNEIHVGNARSAIVFDILFRVLKFLYPNVTYVRNITDIDDKIINKANLESKTCEKISEFWNNSYQNNCEILKLLRPTYQPKATETIKEIIEFITGLINLGFAYENEGSVFFKVSELENYGELSNNHELMETKRISENKDKQDQRDFVLWKPSKLNEPYWNSPWGKGRPGWHIECSAMSLKFLGNKFDIHAGGHDLLFPHHENEHAQNIGLNGENAGPKYWMHNAMLLMNKEKMSKSLGNIILLSDLFKIYNPVFFKYYILHTHYRHMLNFDKEIIESLASKFDTWIFHLGEYFELESEIISVDIEELFNDLNTPGFFVSLDLRLSNAIKNNDKNEFIQLANIFKFLDLNPKVEKADENILNLVEQRQLCKKMKEYSKADELRLEIEKLGFSVLDKANETIVKFKFKSII